MIQYSGVSTLAIGLIASVFISGQAEAASPNGTWKRSNGAHIKVFNCKGGIGMRVVKSPSPKKVGKTIMCGAKKSGANKWQGSLRNLDDGQIYSGYVTLKGNSLVLQGCGLGGLVCKSDTWRRLR